MMRIRLNGGSAWAARSCRRHRRPPRSPGDPGNMAPEGVADLRHGHRAHLVAPGVEIVEGRPKLPIGRHLFEHLAVGIRRSAKPLIRLSLAACSSASVGPLARNSSRVYRPHSAHRRSGCPWSAGRSGRGPTSRWGEIAVCAVGVAALFAHLAGQPRHETAAAQDVVAHEQGKKSGSPRRMPGWPTAIWAWADGCGTRITWRAGNGGVDVQPAPRPRADRPPAGWRWPRPRRGTRRRRCSRWPGQTVVAAMERRQDRRGLMVVTVSTVGMRP